MAKKLRLKGKELQELGYPPGKATGMAINMMLKHYKRQPKEEVLKLLKLIIEQPDNYKEDEVLGRIVDALSEEKIEYEAYQLRVAPEPYEVYGAKGIDESALEQMNTAMQLPIAEAGALMPDAHHGYGLPIGGVLATKNTIIPYGVGMDIGCRMCLTVYDLPVEMLDQKRSELKQMLMDHTKFGKDTFAKPMEDEIFSRSEFKEIPKVKALRSKAIHQIGSSGSGNHFVEFGIVEITAEQNEFDLPLAAYLGVLSHSGSRGLGATIASHYTQLAKERCHLPSFAQHLAWLDLDTEAGMEYWLAMNLAGDYASACHDHIHQRLSKALGEKTYRKGRESS